MNYIAKKIALQEKNILNHADLYLDYNNRIAFHKNRKINLTVKEFDILFFLASYPRQVFTHRQIYETVWGKQYFCDFNRPYNKRRPSCRTKIFRAHCGHRSIFRK